MINSELDSNYQLRDVAATSLLTLYSRAIENNSKEPIILDPLAVEITEKLNSQFSDSNNKLYRKLSQGNLIDNFFNQTLVVYIALRAKQYDQYTRNFLKRYPDGIVVNIGCGLDTRFHIIDNGKVTFYDLDLPEIITLKKKLLAETERYHFISSDVLNYNWVEKIIEQKNKSCLFIAEGVFMYLPEEQVKSLVLKLQSTFPGSELVAEVFNDFWLREPFTKIIDWKLQKELQLGDKVTFKFGIQDSNELEKWNPGIKFIDEWSYLDEQEKKLGWLRIFKSFELFRKGIWTVHYQLN
ncbi:MAG: class I SAM-dependent methyltransferase [Moorea sp. SIO2B7]|nr:class I SAM-dependent methyltransferase [Moorena sp. SIO2B7]